jgi:hypothetical protein
MAKAFDVGLLVRFVPFSTLVNWTLNVTPDTIAPPSFTEENEYHVSTPLPVALNLMADTKDADTYKPLMRGVPTASTATTVVAEKEYAYV